MESNLIQSAEWVQDMCAHTDNACLVALQIVESTLTAEEYVHSEDFFFRTVHLGVGEPDSGLQLVVEPHQGKQLKQLAHNCFRQPRC